MSELINDVDLSQLPQPVLSDHPEWVDLYHFAWRLAAQHIRVSMGRRHMDAAWDPDRNYQWVWDTCFMALFCRYGAGMYPGAEGLDNFYALQRDDGYISMTYDLNTGEEAWPDRINPPLFAWAEWEHYRTTGDASRFERVVPHIELLMKWIDCNRRTEPHRRRRATNGPPWGRRDNEDQYSLYYFSDCGSSGMDDSPRTPRHHEAGRFFDWIDLSCQMTLSFRLLSRIHTALGSESRATHWARRAQQTGDLINAELWCPRTGFYHDRALPDRFVACKTVAGFWPMLAEMCPEEHIVKLIAHLRNEEEFARPSPVPSLSADDPNYCPKGRYFVGGVWAPTNYMITRGLMKVGRHDVAHDIAVRYLQTLERTFHEVEPHTLWECYSPEENLPGLHGGTGKRVKPDFVGWTGIGPTAMLIENVLGLDLNVPEKRINWHIRLTEEHGIRQLAFGPDSRIDLLCRARAAEDEPAHVVVQTDTNLTLHISRPTAASTIHVPAGRAKEIVV